MKIERIRSTCYTVQTESGSYVLVKAPNETWEVNRYTNPLEKIADDFLSLESALDYVQGLPIPGAENKFKSFIENPGNPLNYALKGREIYHIPREVEKAWNNGDKSFEVEYDWGNRILKVIIDRDGDVQKIIDPILGTCSKFQGEWHKSE